MPELYRSSFLDSRATITQFVGIAGNGTPWQGTQTMRDEDLSRDWDHPQIRLVEAANSDICWMEPRDIPPEQAAAGINRAGGGGLQSNYPEGLPASSRPFSREWVPAGIAPSALRATLTNVRAHVRGVPPR